MGSAGTGRSNSGANSREGTPHGTSAAALGVGRAAPNRFGGAGTGDLGVPGASSARRRRRAIRPLAMTGGLAVACGLAALHLAGTTGTAIANGGHDSQLFSLTNQDRTSNGVHSLSFSGTLQNIGEGAPYNCNGIQVHGRSVDMIRRNYFAHPILGCGQYVFSMMQAFGVHYRSAGENIGWEAGSGEPGQLHQRRLHEQHRPSSQHPRGELHRDGRRVRRERARRDLDRAGERAERLDVQRGVRPGGLVVATPTPQATPPKPGARNSPAPRASGRPRSQQHTAPHADCRRRRRC